MHGILTISLAACVWKLPKNNASREQNNVAIITGSRRANGELAPRPK